MKILAFCGAHSLAHVSRPLEVGKALVCRGHEVVFAGAGTYLSVVEDAGYRGIPLPPCTTAEQVAAATTTEGLRNMFRKEDLDECIRKERHIIRQESPDIIMTDNRMTACTSAEIVGVPCVAITNTHMSNWKKIPFYSLRNVWGGRLSGLAGVSDRMGCAAEQWLWDRLVMASMHAVRREHGLPRRYAYAMEEGDLTLFPDVPEFNPARRLPSRVRYTGPLTWRNQLPSPACLDDLDPTRPCVYFTIGSGGIVELIDQAIEPLVAKGFSVVVATGKETDGLPRLPRHAYAEPFVNAEILLPHCDLMVCHGGNGTIYQALRFGLPMVGVSVHAEQEYGLKRVRQHGLGLGWSWKSLRRKGLSALVDGVQTVANDPCYRANAERFKQTLAQWDGAERAAELIETATSTRGRERAGELLLVGQVAPLEHRGANV